MTIEQEQALAAVRNALDVLPGRISQDLAQHWVSELRGVLQQVADAFPEEGARS